MITIYYYALSSDISSHKAEKDELTSINITGSTNNTGNTILKGIFFYLNGTLVKAKTAITNNATFTENTNYEVITAGALNSILGYKWDRISVPATYVLPNRSATITFTKSAGVCNVFWSGGSLSVPAMQTVYEIGNIPTEFIPDADVVAFFTDANTSANSIYMKLTSQGKILVYSYNANGYINVTPTITYIRFEG